MQRFLDYAARVAPDLLARARGAERPSLNRLAELLGRPLLASHVEFLTHFGNSDGGLSLLAPLSTCTLDLIDALEDPESGLPEGAEPFAVGVDEPAVLDGESVTIGGELFGASIEGLAARAVMLAFEMRGATSAVFTASFADAGLAQRIDEARVIAEREGFTVEWFSDACTLAARRGTEMLVIVQPASTGIWMRLTGVDQASIEARAKPFEALGVSFDRWFAMQ